MLKAWNLGQVYGWYSERIFIIYLQTYMWPPIVKYQTKFTVIKILCIVFTEPNLTTTLNLEDAT